MPPKQKQQKKGPTYKNSTLAKDIVPTQIKENPRQARPIKTPETFGQPQKINKLQSPFQAWPSDQVIKAHDFGIASQKRYEDPFHQQISSFIKNEKIVQWKSFEQIQKLKENNQNQNQLSEDQNKSPKSHSNFQSVINNQPLQKKEMVIIQTFLRDQTEEQTQRRLAEQAEKAQKAAKDKKKGKKEEVKQQGPIKVSDVQMKDIIVNKHMCQEGIWIGSQLQIIKLRSITDAYTKQPVWKKIYPQENGVPKLTKSGKYWVKLYYMGKPIKIQVDDRIPINFSRKQMLPLSSMQNQKWSLILSKALIKLFAKIKSDSKVVGNGLIFYALTGMISQTVSLQNYKQWQLIHSYLNDQHYLDKDIFLSCYAKNKQKSPSNYLKNPSEVKDFLLLQNSNFKNSTRSRKNSANQLNSNFRQGVQFQKEEYAQNEVIGGYAYCLGDYFQNGQFNMAFSKQRSQKQTKLRQQYIQLSKVSLSTKTREQKLQHRKKKKQIKQLLSLEQKKRSDMINKDTSSYHFVKLLSDIKIHCQFTERQILLAKKCVANKLNQPPNYQMPGEKQQSKSMKSFSLIKTVKQQTQISPDITDFSVLQNTIDLLPRNQKGIWIKSIDFITTFTEMQIIYNPAARLFQNKKNQTIQSQAQNEYTISQSKQILVIQKKQKAKQEDEEIDNVDLLFGFSYQQSKQDNLVKPYCMLQKFDFNQFSVTSTVVKLNQIIDSKLIHLKNQNNVFRLYTMSKGNFNYQISCGSQFKLMSIGEYLEQFQGYKKQSFAIEYPAFQAKNYICLTKLRIKEQSDSSNSIVVKLNTNIKALSKGLSYKLVKIPQQGKSYTNEEQQGIIQKKNQFKFLAEQYTKIKIEPNDLYYLVVECSTYQNIQQGTCDLIVFSQNQSLEITNVEQVQPTKYIQKYTPNKYGLIFRQRIFSNLQSSQSFYIKLVQGQQIQGGASTDKKNQKKGGKEQPATEIVEKPLLSKKKFNLKILKNEVTLYETKGFNQLTISNFDFPNLKGQINSQYLIEARFDLQEWPDAKKQSEQTSKMYWSIIVFGTDSIALVRDTKQQQREKQTRKSWEDKEPGRAQRAKKARRKFLIELKKQNGEDLNQQQISILSAPRLTKKQQMEEDKKNEQKNKKGAKKEDKKAGKQVKKEQVQQKIQRQFPKSSENCTCQIKEFLRTLQNFQVHYVAKSNDSKAIIRSQQQLNSIKQSSQMSRQNRIGKLIRNIQKRQTINIKEKQKKDQLAIYLQETMSQFKQNWSKYVQWRNQDLQKDKVKQEKERYIIEIINQEKTAISQTQLNKIIAQYKQISGFNQNLANTALMIKKNVKINAISQKISGHLSGWEIQELKLIREQIQKQKIIIQEALLQNIDQMLNQAIKNPTLITEKQNQAKKAKKGGKK